MNGMRAWSLLPLFGALVVLAACGGNSDSPKPGPNDDSTLARVAEKCGLEHLKHERDGRQHRAFHS